jgi:hypothetical protein
MRRPTHKLVLHEPDGRRLLLHEAQPVGRQRGKYYCKYCYKTHRSWWRMADEEYPGPAIICGHCEHVSLIEYAEQ